MSGILGERGESARKDFHAHVSSTLSLSLSSGNNIQRSLLVSEIGRELCRGRQGPLTLSSGVINGLGYLERGERKSVMTLFNAVSISLSSLRGQALSNSREAFSLSLSSPSSIFLSLGDKILTFFEKESY